MPQIKFKNKCVKGNFEFAVCQKQKSDQNRAELHLTINFHFSKGKHQAKQESDLPYSTVDL